MLVCVCVCHVVLFGMTLLSSGVWFAVNSEAKSCCASGTYCGSHWAIFASAGPRRKLLSVLSVTSSEHWIYSYTGSLRTVSLTTDNFFCSGACSNIRLLASPCFIVRIYNALEPLSGFSWDSALVRFTGLYQCGAVFVKFGHCWRTWQTDIADGHCWRTLLTDMTEGHCWRALLTDMTDGHYWRTLLTDMTGGHCWRTLLTDIVVGHCCRTLLSDIVDGHCWRTLLTDIANGHDRWTLLTGIAVGHCWRTLLTDMTDGHCGRKLYICFSKNLKHKLANVYQSEDWFERKLCTEVTPVHFINTSYCFSRQPNKSEWTLQTCCARPILVSFLLITYKETSPRICKPACYMLRPAMALKQYIIKQQKLWSSSH